jgi:MFS family permease
VIAASVLGSGIAAIDATVVAVALPATGDDLNAGMAPLQPVVTGYLPSLASFLLLAGYLSDQFGRRRNHRHQLPPMTLYITAPTSVVLRE